MLVKFSCNKKNKKSKLVLITSTIILLSAYTRLNFPYIILLSHSIFFISVEYTMVCDNECNTSNLSVIIFSSIKKPFFTEMYLGKLFLKTIISFQLTCFGSPLPQNISFLVVTPESTQ